MNTHNTLTVEVIQELRADIKARGWARMIDMLYVLDQFEAATHPSAQNLAMAKFQFLVACELEENGRDAGWAAICEVHNHYVREVH